MFPPLAEAAREHGMTVVHYSRPDFGRSTAQHGRTVANAAGDVAAVLDALAHDVGARLVEPHQHEHKPTLLNGRGWDPNELTVHARAV